MLRTNTNNPLYDFGTYLFISLCPLWADKCIQRIAHFPTINNKNVKQAYTFNCNDGSSVKITLIDCIKDKNTYNNFIKGTEYEELAFSLLFGVQ